VVRSTQSHQKVTHLVKRLIWFLSSSSSSNNVIIGRLFVEILHQTWITLVIKFHKTKETWLRDPREKEIAFFNVHTIPSKQTFYESQTRGKQISSCVFAIFASIISPSSRLCKILTKMNKFFLNATTFFSRAQLTFKFSRECP
jgi:hypothetical protein